MACNTQLLIQNKVNKVYPSPTSLSRGLITNPELFWGMYTYLCVIITVHADGLAPSGARPSAGTVMIKFGIPQQYEAGTLSVNNSEGN